jgi:spore cortex formation protein SpoVR/YcgB (stage V sporulation)
MMSDREKEVAKMIEEINHLADKLISDTYSFRYKIAKRMLFLASLGVLFSFIAISLHAYLN